ncbi:MAG: glycosyltransferase family 39 protein [Candidatus Bathyarchaeota archaeon]|nr:glycosyltransferase family 39 protein [Candidatus Bathyarchaeum sp.]
MEHLKTVLKNSLPLLGILLGFALLSVATGEFTNYDTGLEYNATLGVNKWGLPYHEFGHYINQPPLGFYTGALFLRVIGSSYSLAVTVPTLFGAGCLILLYQLGIVLYDKRTGLFAAGIFAVTPWHIVISRSFLIDAQCLFFSLLYLLVGIYATKRNSAKLFLLSGAFFGVAFLTKAFAVFLLVPLAIYYLYAGQRNLWRIFMGAVYFVPALIFTYVWYELITNRGFFAAFTHDDFNFQITGAVPSPFFLLYYLLGTVGLFFLAAGGVSLLVSFLRTKKFGKIFLSDMICLAAIVTILGVNLYLVLGRNLICAYNNPVKYDYQFLPLLCLLAASLLNKFHSLDPTNLGNKRNKLIFMLTLIGLVLIVMSMIQNVLVLNSYVTQTGVLFRVEEEMGYSFEHISHKDTAAISWVLQWLGFAVVVFTLFWSNKDKLKTLATTLKL